VGEKHPPHPRVALAEDLAGPLHGHLPHQGHGEGLELMGEVLAATFRGKAHTITGSLLKIFRYSDYIGSK
jgi:hypothetical protein